MRNEADADFPLTVSAVDIRSIKNTAARHSDFVLRREDRRDMTTSKCTLPGLGMA